jgi:hypothetical protein
MAVTALLLLWAATYQRPAGKLPHHMHVGLGYSVPAHMNPRDFYMVVSAGA